MSFNLSLNCLLSSYFIVFVMRWQRRLLRRPRHDDGLTNHNRSGLQLHQEYDYLVARLGVKPHRYSRTDNRDSPSDRYGRPLSDSSRRTPCCGLQEGDRLSLALSVSTLQGRWAHLLYRQCTSHAPGYTNSCNTPVRA